MIDSWPHDGGTVRERIRIEGPPVRLRSTTVQTLAPALHELATNARKYGALVTDEGRLTVTWAVREADGVERRLALDWVEDRTIRALEGRSPTRGGYGCELTERALPYRLGARTRDETGVRCTFNMPLEKGERRGTG